MLYHGFLALTAGSDDEKLQKGIGGIKYGAFALIGI
jgi:hypothetical protein